MSYLNQLQQATEKHDFVKTEIILHEMECHLSSEDLITVLIDFIESNPGLDLGMPGPIIHFLEKKGNYEQYLISATQRRPNWYLLWMLNRCINGNSVYKMEMLEVLAYTAKRTDIEPSVAQDAQEFYEFQME